MHTNHQTFPKVLHKQLSRNFITNNICSSSSSNGYFNKAIGFSRKFGQIRNNNYYYNGHYYPLKCLSSSSTSSKSPITREERVVELEGKNGNSLRKEEKSNDIFGYLVRDENGWKVRRMVESEEEMRKVAKVQAQAFHEPVLLFNDFFFEFFQAEVLAGLIYRLRNSAPDRYACLVAEGKEEKEMVVGVVDATVYRDYDVLRHLRGGADEYLYISGIAVLTKFRRKKVATALLKACEIVANIWGYEYLVLRAYEDDFGAQKLYSNEGYKVVSRDPPWISSWIGRRRRVLMVKRSNNNIN